MKKKNNNEKSRNRAPRTWYWWDSRIKLPLRSTDIITALLKQSVYFHLTLPPNRKLAECKTTSYNIKTHLAQWWSVQIKREVVISLYLSTLCMCGMRHFWNDEMLKEKKNRESVSNKERKQRRNRSRNEIPIFWRKKN